jgi:hypothetical protein
MTAGRIILDMPNPALDRNGNPYSKAKLYFYQNDTTNLQTVYTDPTLIHALPNPLISDSAGRFPSIWADISAVFDVKWTDANDALIYTFDKVSALATAVAPDGSGVHPAAFRAALELGSAAVQDIGSIGNKVPLMDNDNDWEGDQNFTGGLEIHGFPAGYRNLVTGDTQNADYTFVLDDEGKRVLHTSASPHAWTIPPGTEVDFHLGATIVLRNRGTGVLTITRGVGVTLRIVGNSTDQDVTLAAWGMAALVNDVGDIWCISGVGLT